MADYPGGNRVLDSLPLAERRALLHGVSIVALKRYDATATVGLPFAHVDFPIGALISLVAVFENGATNEVGVVGREGFAPIEVVMGEETAQRATFCQVPGKVARVPIRDFRHELGMRGALLELAHLNLSARLFTAEQLMSCNVAHSVRQRCARWLLMTRDRIDASEFMLTHDFLGLMLGVRRAGVSEAASALQRLGAIRYRRGTVTITDAGRLSDAACECYGATRDAFERALARQAAANIA